MNKKPFLTICCFVFLLFACQIAIGQPGSEKKENKNTNADGSYSVQKIEKGSQLIPKALGGGEAPANSLMIVSPSWRGGKEVTPQALGVDNLLPARWLDKEHFLFLGTDAVDIQDYFIYFSGDDKIYKCDFAVGEKIGYSDFEEGKTFEFTIENEIITDFRVK